MFKIKTAKEALATHLGCDIADLTDYRYQPTCYTKAVYAVHETIMCANKSGPLPQVCKLGMGKVEW